MVTAVTSLSRSGLSDWLVQRVTAVILLAFFGFIGFKLAGGVSYAEWSALFAQSWMKVFALLAALSLAAHAWIGMWTVGTDYIRPHYFGAHATAWRLTYQAGCLVVLFVYVAWALQMFWAL